MTPWRTVYAGGAGGGGGGNSASMSAWFQPCASRTARIASRLAWSPVGGTVVMVFSVRWAAPVVPRGRRRRSGSADAAQSPVGAGLVGRRAGREKGLGGHAV